MILDSQGRPTLYVPQEQQIALAGLARRALDELGSAIGRAIQRRRGGNVELPIEPVYKSIAEAFLLGTVAAGDSGHIDDAVERKLIEICEAATAEFAKAFLESISAGRRSDGSRLKMDASMILRAVEKAYEIGANAA